jgi:nucleoside diphosphate kinase
MGRDAEAEIKVDNEGREYIKVGKERRYWGGIIESLPADERIHRLNDFTMVAIKPDGMALGIEQAVTYLISRCKCEVVGFKDVLFDQTMIRKLYPHFFAETWEKLLFDYMMSGKTRCLIVKGKNVHSKMMVLRNSIRHLFGLNGRPRVKSLIHCAQTKRYAITQALIVYDLDELVKIVGIRSHH